MLEKTLESPLDCKEIQTVQPKGNQSWMFIGRTDAEAETPILWPPDAKNWLIGKDPDAGKDWGQREKGRQEKAFMILLHFTISSKYYTCKWTVTFLSSCIKLPCCLSSLVSVLQDSFLKVAASLVAQMIMNLPAIRETPDRFLGWEDSVEGVMATHSSILPWRIPMDRGASWATLHGVAKTWTWLND